jgi:predicted  nucleic acid-binding Zn-ribbon protein
MKYADQAKWFLNGFWTEGAEKETENVWKCAQKFIELDAKKAEGNELDEFWSHKFLEFLGETLTVIQLREKLRKIDMDANGKMALLEYLLFKYNKPIKDVVTAPQGDNQDEVNAAQSAVQEAQSAFTDLSQKLEEQTNALEEQKRAEADLKKAEAELKAAVDDLRSQEDSYKNKCAELEKKSKDPTGGTVAKSKAAAELAQLKQENPLPLRKAKITQEAALRKVEKQRIEAEARTRDCEEKAKQVEAAMKEAEARLQEAQDLLEAAKKKSGTPFGSIWWMERELKEAQKYLPKRKQQP